jgi:hypothetical protein
MGSYCQEKRSRLQRILAHEGMARFFRAHKAMSRRGTLSRDEPRPGGGLFPQILEKREIARLRALASALQLESRS